MNFLPVWLLYLATKKTCFFLKHHYLLRNKQYSDISWVIGMVKWFCSSTLCFNNFTSKDCNGRPLKYYRLPREESIQSKYRKILELMEWIGIKAIYVRLTGVMLKIKLLMICLTFEFLQTNCRIREKIETAKNFLEK